MFLIMLGLFMKQKLKNRCNRSNRRARHGSIPENNGIRFNSQDNLVSIINFGRNGSYQNDELPSYEQAMKFNEKINDVS